MKTYARMVDGIAVEIFPPLVADQDIFKPGPKQSDGKEGEPVLDIAKGADIPIDRRLHPDIVAQLVEYDPANPPPPPLAPVLPVEQRLSALKATIAEHLDAAAQARGYDDIKSAALRAGFSGPYQAEGIAFAAWMDTTWHKAYALLAQWQTGQLAEPTAAALVAMLPALQLPDVSK